jgi:hypothetical protein
MSYDYSSESKRLELPNPYTLQNRLLWLCAAVLLAAGVTSLFWAKNAMQDHALRFVAAPLGAGLAMVALGLVCATTAAQRMRFFFGRGRPASLAPEIAVGATGGSPLANGVKEILRQGGLSYPEPKGAIEGLLYHWVPKLITAPIQVQFLAQRDVFNLAAISATLVSFLVSWFLFAEVNTRPWICMLYFAFSLVVLLRPMVSQNRARVSRLTLVFLIAASILAPVFIALMGKRLPPLGGFDITAQTFVMLVAALVACGLTVLAVLAQVDGAPQTRASVEQSRLSMNSPPGGLMDELDRLMQSAWTESIPNRRYARIDPLTPAATPSGSFAGELLEESQPLPLSGTKAPSFAAALKEPRHRALLLLDVFGCALVLASVLMTLKFVNQFDATAVWQENHFSLVGTSAILSVVAGFCFAASSRLWGRFNFESILVWVEMVGSYQTSRIGTGQSFLSRMSTENNVVRTEAMTLRVWRARIESVVFGKDSARQVTAMFSTEKDAKALSASLMSFAGDQSVLVAPSSAADQSRMVALGASEQVLGSGGDEVVGAAAQVQHHLQTAAAIASTGSGVSAVVRFCSACAHEVQPGAKFCSQCAAPLG